ncbi:hypothetical protein C8J56DRAFT_1057083 [Mycena floridula]|nr:hypothetical protein C8J56DRAFT_1057083 [Mycena floridula]
MVQKRMSGAELFNNYALLSTATKEKLVESYAQVNRDDLHGQTSPDGQVAGIIDWELHCVKPAITAVYPHWLLYRGYQDPQFSSPGSWWQESPVESARLWGIFEKMVEARDPEYLQALQLGKSY